MLGEQLAHQLGVLDASAHKNVPRRIGDLAQIAEISGIGQLVEIHHNVASRDALQHKARANKSRSARHQNNAVHRKSRFLSKIDLRKRHYL